MTQSMTSTLSTGTTISFDPKVLKQKYAEERNKRLHPNGIHQYHRVEGTFDQSVDDPYIIEPLKRDPIEEDCDVLVIGGGYGGLLVAARLAEAGVTNIRIVEKAGDFGGTWYWNRYPGECSERPVRGH